MPDLATAGYPVNRIILSAPGIAAVLPCSPTLAQQTAPVTRGVHSATNATDAAVSGGGTPSDSVPPVPGSATDAHKDQDQAIVVTGVRRKAEDILGGVSVLDEAELN